MRYLAPIVEGHGEVEALPPLLHRIARFEGYQGVLSVNPPIRVKSGSFLNDRDYFRKYVALAAAKAAQENGGILILLDCDDGCAGTLGPELLAKAQAVRANVTIVVALACREFESWFIAAVRSLGGRRGIADDLEPPQASDAIRNAKGWLSGRMNVPYDPVTHQLEFSKAFDLAQARANQSFDRFCARLSGFLSS